jgi:hypothetical protein
MPIAKSTAIRPLLALFLLLGWPTAAAFAEDLPAGGSAAAPAALASNPAPESTMVSLIKRLEARGALTKQDADILIAQAEADAADARVQAAEILLAAAKADAASARVQASLAREGALRAETASPGLPMPAPLAQAPAPVPVPVAPPVPALAEESRRVAPIAPVDENAAPTAVAETPPATVGTAANEPAVDGDDGSVRVPYVPEVVKNELRQEVKDDVLAEARKENWGGSHPFPDWVTRFTLSGDVRVRYEYLYNHKTNDDSGNAFPNFNAINTGSPFDLAGSVPEPQYNVDQDRDRMRIRARLAADIDLQNGFTTGLRFATGNDDQPVSENQTLGASGNAQGGDFSKYDLWLDRAYIKYQTGGDPTTDISVTAGRFANPFFSTNLIWASDLNFDGLVASVPLKVHWNGRVDDAVKPFLVAGIFPVFNTDLNYATDNAAKFSSYDKWMDAVQGGVQWKAGDFNVKMAAAYYYFKNMEGQLSTPFTPLNSSDAGSTDASRPSFAQNGNTYMEIRDIVPGPLNDNGTIDQFQYFGLATPFHEFAATGRVEYNHFEPFQISLTGEFVENMAFNEAAVAAVAVNNLGPANSSGVAPFIGGNKGWFANLKFGDAVLQEAGDWNLGIGYRYLQSDAVVDGFTDADFGGDLLGTNLEGYTLDGSVSLGHGVWFETRFYAASAIAGPSYKNDYLQLDLNTKF